MATNYTNLLGFALPTTGELAGTWGQVVNDSITELVEDSIAGTATVNVTSGDVTLTTTGSGAANEARCAIIRVTGTPGTARNVIAPSQSKEYIVINQSDSNVTFKGAATSGHLLKPGEANTLAWNGSDYIDIEQGDVAGPASATDNAVVRFDGTSGKLVQNSAVTIADTTGDIETSGNIIVGDGSASLPSITNVGDTNTGIYFSAANEVSISTDGTQRFVVDATGEVGIGTASPGVKLDVVGVVRASSWFAGSTNLNLYGDQTSTSGATLLQAGNFGIGTTTPSQKLHVAVSTGSVAGLVESTATSGEASWQVTGKNSGGTARSAIFKYDNTDVIRIATASAINMQFETNDTKRLTITSAGFTQPVAYADTVVALGNTGTATNINMQAGNVFTATLTGNCTFTLQNPIATGASSFTLILTNDGTAGRTVAWSGGSFNFPGGAASLSRTTTANATDIWAFFTPNGGSTWYGNIVMKDVKA